MPKTISDQKFRRGAHLIDTVLQPLLKRVVDEANETLKREGIRIALDANWAIDEVEPTKTDGSDEDKDV